ncbi:hypothetical protein HZC07_06080 [Candidatus Micrarchaeota archaeon]|nr:hypothetical protein [Candidatus Micrarchaeota archaeon]
MSIYTRLVGSRFGQILASRFRSKQPELEQPQKPPIDRQALLEEISARVYAEIRSKWPGKSVEGYGVTETHAKRDTTRLSRNIPGYRDIVDLMGDDTARIKNSVKSLFFRSLSLDLYLFHMGGWAYDLSEDRNRDGHGRPCDVQVFMVMPKDTAQKLIDFVGKQDKRILFDIYKMLFPKNYDVNRIKISSSLTINVDGNEVKF